MKVITIGSTRCVHCKNLKNYINSEYSEDEVDGYYRYFLVNSPPDGESEITLFTAAMKVMRDLNLKSVPVTILVDESKKQILDLVRGNNTKAVKDLMSIAIKGTTFSDN